MLFSLQTNIIIIWQFGFPGSFFIKWMLIKFIGFLFFVMLLHNVDLFLCGKTLFYFSPTKRDYLFKYYFAGNMSRYSSCLVLCLFLLLNKRCTKLPTIFLSRAKALNPCYVFINKRFNASLFISV